MEKIILTTELTIIENGTKILARKIVSTDKTVKLYYELPNVTITRNLSEGEIISEFYECNGKKCGYEISDNGELLPVSEISSVEEAQKNLNAMFSSEEITRASSIIEAVQSHTSLEAPEILKGKNFTLFREVAYTDESDYFKSISRFIPHTGYPETIYTIGENFVSALHTPNGIDYFLTYDGEEYDFSAKRVAKLKFGSNNFKEKGLYLKVTRLQKSLTGLKNILDGKTSPDEYLERKKLNTSANQPN